MTSVPHRRRRRPTGSVATKLLLQMGFPVRPIALGQRVDGVIIWDRVCRLRRPAMPKAWRRSGYPADGDRTVLAAT